MSKCLNFYRLSSGHYLKCGRGKNHVGSCLDYTERLYWLPGAPPLSLADVRPITADSIMDGEVTTDRIRSE